MIVLKKFRGFYLRAREKKVKVNNQLHQNNRNGGSLLHLVRYLYITPSVKD